MAYFNLENFISILKISVILFFSSFAFFLPLVALLKSYKKALQYTIPVSISIHIIFGYCFYSFGQIKIYPLSYLIFVIILNAWTILRLELWQKIPRFKFKNHILSSILFFAFLSTPIIYTRFHDAVKNIAPGAIDTYNHFLFLLHDLGAYGHLSYASYAPGFHMFLYPLSIFVPGSEIYRFTGPILGILVILSIWLLFKDNFKNKISKYFLLLLFIFPVFNQLILQTIGFFPTALTFIFFPFLIYLLAQPKELPEKFSVIFYLLAIIALALTVPYFYVQYIPALIIVLLIIFLFRKIFDKSYLLYASKLLLIAFLGIFIAFGHVYLQTKVLKRGEGFPITEIAYDENSEAVVTGNYKEMSLWLARFFKKMHLDNLSRSDLVNNYLSRILTTGGSILTPKNIRPLDNFLSIGAYLWTVLAIFICYIATKKKNKILFIISIFSIIFGIITATGILEMLTYRGRGGWYLMLLALLGAAYLFDILYSRTYEKLVYVVFAAVFISGFISPPAFYRAYFTEPFAQAYEISKKFSGKDISFITAEKRLIMISENFKIFPRSQESLSKGCLTDECFLILENKFLDIDPVRSQKAVATDRTLQKFQKQQELLKKSQEEAVTKIKGSPQFSFYKKYWENENITVYKYTNK